jgi:hypothetical protein
MNGQVSVYLSVDTVRRLHRGLYVMLVISFPVIYSIICLPPVQFGKLIFENATKTRIVIVTVFSQANLTY